MTAGTTTAAQTTAATITCPAGFEAAGLACGIKPSGAPDLALLQCPDGASVAAVFTTNLVCGAPITVSRKHLAEASGTTRAIVINSGCANAATGQDGIDRANGIGDALAGLLECPPAQVLMNSTGVIGMTLASEPIIAALPTLLGAARPDGLVDAAHAIMTTDTTAKMTEQTVEHDGRTCRVVGIAKGSGMIHPNMATMIGVIMTDAECAPDQLDVMVRDAVDRSFHRISVDGDTSTNDSVFLMASGAAGVFPEADVARAVEQVAVDLARMIVADGEGARKLIEVTVTGAATDDGALQIARTVAGSMLVRTAVAGGDPNWGRILAAAGRSGVMFDPADIALHANGISLYADGRPTGSPPEALRAAFSEAEVRLSVDVGSEPGTATVWTCDLTEGYVQINAEYTT